jgi:hypothetical protein
MSQQRLLPRRQSGGRCRYQKRQIVCESLLSIMYSELDRAAAYKSWLFESANGWGDVVDNLQCPPQLWQCLMDDGKNTVLHQHDRSASIPVTESSASQPLSWLANLPFLQHENESSSITE